VPRGCDLGAHAPPGRQLRACPLAARARPAATRHRHGPPSCPPAVAARGAPSASGAPRLCPGPRGLAGPPSGTARPERARAGTADSEVRVLIQLKFDDTTVAELLLRGADGAVQGNFGWRCAAPHGRTEAATAARVRGHAEARSARGREARGVQGRGEGQPLASPRKSLKLRPWRVLEYH
jgi:hypothetical protein